MSTIVEPKKETMTTTKPTYENRAVYQGEIIDENLGFSRSSQPQLRLTAKLSGMCVNPYKPEAGVKDLPQELKTVQTIFVGLSDEVRVKALRDLESYGYPGGGKIEMLAYDHPEHWSMIGKTGYFSCSARPDEAVAGGFTFRFWLTGARGNQAERISAAKAREEDARFTGAPASTEEIPY